MFFRVQGGGTSYTTSYHTLYPLPDCILVSYGSAPTATLICERRTTDSSGYVLRIISWLISGPHILRSSPIEHSHTFLSLTLSIVRASKHPRPARTRITCIRARSTAPPVCLLLQRGREPKMILIFRLECSQLWLEEANHARADCS